MLAAIGIGATTGAALVDYSGLATGTAAEHLLTDRMVVQEVVAAAGSGGGAGRGWKSFEDDYLQDTKLARRAKVRRVERDDMEIVEVLIFATIEVI